MSKAAHLLVHCMFQPLRLKLIVRVMVNMCKEICSVVHMLQHVLLEIEHCADGMGFQIKN
jgi:hypothetical protein